MLFLLLLLILFSGIRAQAEGTLGVIIAKTVIVREEPSPMSDSLLTLKRGQKVLVLEARGLWVEVKVFLKNKFSFRGWIPAKTIQFNKDKLKSPPTLQPPLSRTATPTPIPVPTPGWTPIPSRAKIAMPTEVREERSLSKAGWFSLDPTFHFLQYDLNSAGSTPGNVYSYHMIGAGLGLKGGYWFWQKSNVKLGGELAYEYSVYRFNTLTVTVGGTTTTAKPKCSAQDIALKIPLEYSFSTDPKSSSLGFAVGIKDYIFNGDDKAGGLATLVV